MSVGNDAELVYYQLNGATSNDLQDAEREFLTLQGFAVGTNQDRWFLFLRSLLYEGALSDMRKLFWDTVLP